MDQHRFDELVKVLGRGAALPRRVLLRRLAAGLLGGGLIGRSGRAFAQPGGCRGEGHPCEGNQEEWCCPGLRCAEKGEAGPGNARRCVADLGQRGGVVRPGASAVGEDRDAGNGDTATRDRALVVNTGPQTGAAGNGGVVDATAGGGAVIVGDVASGSAAGSGVGVGDEEPVDSGG